jgi:V/A-type H+-transporting ATPase subunit G/H
MEKTEILEKIKDAEKKVEEDILSLEEERKKTILNAKLEARKTLEDAQKEAEKVREEIIEKARSLIEAEKGTTREKWSEEITKVETKGKANVESAVDFLFNEFLRMVEHA